MLVVQLYTLRNNCIRQFTGRDAVRTTKLNLRDLHFQRNCLCKMTGMTALDGLLSGLEYGNAPLRNEENVSLVQPSRMACSY